jgi:4-coumarate--CoA ligase
MSSPAYVLEHAAELGDEPTDRRSDRRVLSYAQLADKVARLAGGLRARGFGPGDVLGVMAPNLPEYAVLFHGVAMAGGTITTINPTSPLPRCTIS